MSGTIAIAGVTPRDVVTPSDLGELAETVRELHAGRKAFAFVGGGTELELGNAPRALDTVVRTVQLDRVVDYTPEDQTITVEAGMTLAALDRLLAGNRQMLPLDVADRERATIGGAIATNASGRRRTRYGTAKDLIVGVQIVRPDGVVARGGGKVVKNVAGFDLPKLMVGSLGTLGAIASVTLRVYPIPETIRVVTARQAGGDFRPLCDALIASQLEPESVVAAGGDVLVTFAGLRSGVDAQAARAREILTAAGLDGARDADEGDRSSADRAEHAVRTIAGWRVRVLFPPAPQRSHGGPYRPCGDAAKDVVYPLAGVALGAQAGVAGEARIAVLREQVAAATGGNGRVVVHAMPPEARGTVDAWGGPPPSFSLMRAMKIAFDPLNLSNPGRFVGGL